KRKTIEDLVGLSYFDEKKSESIKQLDDADRRLEIALAKMGEIKKRIDELEEERNQKLRSDILQRELNRYNAISAANKMKVVLSEKTSKDISLREISLKIKNFEDERTEIRAEIDDLEGQKSSLMQEADDYNQAKATIDSELSQAMQQFEVHNSGIVASTKRLEQIDSRIPEIKNELEVISNSREGIDSKISQVKVSINETNVKIKKINDDMQGIDSIRDKILEEQSRASSKKLEIDNKIKNLNGELNSTQLKLSKVQNEKAESEIKVNSNSHKLLIMEQDLAKLSDMERKLGSMNENHKATITELKSRILKLNSKKTKILKDSEELNLILEKSSKAAAQYETKIKTVKGIMHEDYTVAKLKEDAEKLGIKGLVYEMISWEKQYERSVLAVSSDWIKAIVVKDFATLLGIAEVARTKNLPKLKIIPLEAIPNFKLNLPKHPGIVGVLSDYVKCDSEYSALKTFLFGNVVLTNSRESAYSISKSGYKAVTLGGEFFEAKGGGVIIDINSKISKLTKIISLSSSIDGLLQSINLLRKYILKKKNTLKKIDLSIQNYSDRLSISEKALVSTDENYSHLKSRMLSANKTKSQLIDRISELKSKNKILAAESSTIESHVESLVDRISIVEENYASGEQTRISNELTKMNIKKSEIEKLHTAIMNEYRDKSSQLAEVESEANRSSSQAKNLHEEEASLLFQKQELKNKIQTLEQEKESKKIILEKLREKEQELISTSGTSIGQIKEYDDKLKVLSDKNQTLTKEVNSLERQSDSLNRDLSDLAETETKLQKLLETFGFDVNMETFDVEPIVQGLSSELNSLNALNAKAPETYLEVSYGYRSMSTRKNSLEEERNSIVKFIEGIEKDKRQTFLNAFDVVDKEIRLIFNKMTGGNAWLELQNEDDIFTSGISYLIQFKNKPKRESTSISGGEKTLAAIVFVLALQKLKPSPFYLFDEVDAHLDAPNAEKLSNILEERSKESQFIMVSLKDSVVNKAKLIYGVYPKNGVSHVVTYKDKRMPSVKTS
ncbi:MAG: chromosome segregation protein SMC, partial [Nitrosopumilus sp.]|nr:chromosome segregation protein SMC [Nitrosopumilus sp.]